MSGHLPNRTDHFFAAHLIWRFPARIGQAAQFLFGLWLGQSTGMAQLQDSSSQSARTPEYRDDRILIMPRPGTSRSALANFHAAQKATVMRTFEGIGGLQILLLPEGAMVPT